MAIGNLPWDDEAWREAESKSEAMGASGRVSQLREEKRSFFSRSDVSSLASWLLAGSLGYRRRRQ